MFETMIGIGRVPEATLDINSDPGDDALRVRVNNATTFRVLSNQGTTIGGNPGTAPANGLYVAGSTGMGTTSPTEKLQVNGALRLNGSASSNNPAAGTVRWNPTTVDFEGYDGTNWKSLTGQPNTNQTKYEVGDRAQGGIVFWVTPDGRHGRVIHLHEMFTESGGRSIKWSNITLTRAGAGSSTQGEQNTLAIINQAGHTESAAFECYNLEADGYDDWYLPAKDEIENLLLPNISIVQQALLDWGGSDFLLTWTSTESTITGSNEAYSFGGGSTTRLEPKGYLRNIRAIRSF